MALTKAHNRMIEGVPVNVLDFGADRTGTSTSHAEIQDAIDHASANGKAVYIPSGDYKMAGIITVPSFMTIYGSGPQSRLFRDTSVDMFDFMRIKSTSDIQLKDFKIDGVTKEDNASYTSNYSGVRVCQTIPEVTVAEALQTDFTYTFPSPASTSDFAVYRNQVLQTLTTDYTVNLATSTVTLNAATGAGAIIIIANLGGTEAQPHNILLEGLHIEKTTGGEQQAAANTAGIVLEDCYDVTVSKCRLEDNRSAGILISQVSSYGIRSLPPFQTNKIRISDCVGYGEVFPFDNSWPSGFGSFITGNQFEEMQVSGCYADGFGYTNIGLNGQKQSVTGCISLNSSYAGITLGHPSEGSRPAEVVCSNNICLNNNYAGITSVGATNLLISGNALANNCVTDSAAAEIEVRYDSNYVAGTSDKITISDNVIRDGNAVGIQCEVGNSIFITGNQIHDCGNRALFLTQKNATDVMEVFVANNYLKDSGTSTQSAIEVSATTGAANALCMNNYIFTSDVSTKQGMGITAVGSLADVQVHDNWFSTGYVGTLNTNFGARNTKAFNAFSSGTLTLSTRLLTP